MTAEDLRGKEKLPQLSISHYELVDVPSVNYKGVREKLTFAFNEKPIALMGLFKGNEEDPESYFTFNVPTNVSVQQGLTAMAESYARLREAFGQIPEAKRWVDRIKEQRPEEPSELEPMSIFIGTQDGVIGFDYGAEGGFQPKDLVSEISELKEVKDGLGWIRIETPYSDYYMGEDKYPRDERSFGIVSRYRIPDEATRLFTDFSPTNIPEEKLTELRNALNSLTNYLPELPDNK